MFTILCGRHKEEFNRKAEELGIVKPPKNATDEVVGRVLVLLMSIELDNKYCSGCRVVGLSKRGIIEDLDSPAEWMYS